MYELQIALPNDLEMLVNFKLKTIFEYIKDIDNKEKQKIINYVQMTIPKLIKDYKIISINNQKCGCVLLRDYEDGKMLDEIYLKEEYRNKGIGTNIIKDILVSNKNKPIYLWVYKDNNEAISLYKRLGFIIINETDARFYMKNKNE